VDDLHLTSFSGHPHRNHTPSYVDQQKARHLWRAFRIPSTMRGGFRPRVSKPVANRWGF